MSPRRAFSTAILLSVVPTFILFGGITKYSENICIQLSEKWEIPKTKQEELLANCNQTVKKSNWLAFIWVLFASILINWPVIRWLDDRQWYREWINKK